MCVGVSVCLSVHAPVCLVVVGGVCLFVFLSKRVCVSARETHTETDRQGRG